MSSRRTIEIVGGGLAGLALGRALRHRGVPVTVFEAGVYPRPKVCGEFIAGLDATTIRQLELGALLAPQRQHQLASWHDPTGERCRQHLPAPAIGVSRHWLDTTLAEEFRARGGELHERTRVDRSSPPTEGRVLACGRRHAPGGWIGLKRHFRNVTLSTDLEMHLGRGAYVGLARVEEDRVNVCGLFTPQFLGLGSRADALDRALRAAELNALADRLAAAAPVGDAYAAIAGVRFGFMRPPRAILAIGDAYAAIPPFTGHGMAMALQGAAIALEPLQAWSEGRMTWAATVVTVRRQMRRVFLRRLAIARMVHPWLLSSRRQRWITCLQNHGLLPLRLLYHALH